MKVYQLKALQNLPINIKDAWEFFSNPNNLSVITPEWLNFKITSKFPDKMYQFWHHQHHFIETDNGVEMTDIVNYALPFDPFSRPINSFLVEKKVKEIFKFREKKLMEMFVPAIASS